MKRTVMLLVLMHAGIACAEDARVYCNGSKTTLEIGGKVYESGDAEWRVIPEQFLGRKISFA
ncbi:hypothetical protein [Pontiella desulfatans]|uniref:hypothetical protein n=1 Tax=Pontiella desulfatans TaxID=2750659 RepID=UPI001443B71D|nr:hypothetical protein [Pontiella desulfatans]